MAGSRLMRIFVERYEALAVWSRPWVTAWIAIGYFAAAFVGDDFSAGGLLSMFADRPVS